MNKGLKKIITFLLNFIVSTSLMLGFYYYFRDTPYKQLSQAFDGKNIRKTCPKSPENESFQKCFNPYIVRLLDLASPLEVINLTQKLIELKERDLFQSEDKKIEIYREYLNNWVVFTLALSGYEIKRDQIDFFQIIFLPYLRNRVAKKISLAQEEIYERSKEYESFLKDEMTKRNLDIFLKAKIKVY